jgi:hypothetical protein
MQAVLMDWQSALQRSTIYCCEPAACVHVDMLQSVYIREAIVKSVVVDVDVRNARVVNVHVAEVAPSRAIPGDKRLSKSQRAPSEASAKADAKTKAPAATAVPSN